MDYFMHWVSLIQLESASENSYKDVKEIYTIPPIEREKNAQCLSNMVLIDCTKEAHDMYKHTFRKISSENANLFESLICDGNYVVISTDERPAVATGFVHHKDVKNITVTIDRYRKQLKALKVI